MSMEKKDVIAFFDRLAPQWDADMIRSDRIIGRILDNAGVREGVHVLDVACGTGVLFPDYLARDVASVTAVDISPEMVKIAQSKFPEEKVKVLCADVESLQPERKFDCIMVYNAFPHFPEPEKLIRVLAGMLQPGGSLTVAHGMSRAKIDRHHEGTASRVSVGLMHEDALAAIMEQYLDVTVKISDDNMYQVTGVLKK
jgi:demethylmenaquinone methyltransferase/2-methoxy-6-polyprenyl-1,4-benzoquinol methylase